MLRVYLLMVAVLAPSAVGETKQHDKPRKSAAQAAQPEPAPAAAQPPLPTPPPTPEQGPSSPPEVSFQSGRLTIVARNSTLGDVLSAVKQKTGASVDMPAVSSERVVGQFGPGAPRDVMAQLLNGSHYDYVLLGSPSDPGALKKVVLMARANGPEPSPAEDPRTARQRAPDQPSPDLQAVPEAESDNAVEENPGEPTPDAAQQPQEEPQPEGQPDQQGEQPNGPTVKTPEQLLRELQQQQQQQQNGPPGAPGQPPQ